MMIYREEREMISLKGTGEVTLFTEKKEKIGLRVTEGLIGYSGDRETTR